MRIDTFSQYPAALRRLPVTPGRGAIHRVMAIDDRREENELRARIADHGDMWVFLVLTDLQGNIVSTRRREPMNQFGIRKDAWLWDLGEAAQPRWVRDFKRGSTLEEKGFRKAYAVLPAVVVMVSQPEGGCQGEPQDPGALKPEIRIDRKRLAGMMAGMKEVA